MENRTLGVLSKFKGGPFENTVCRVHANCHKPYDSDLPVRPATSHQGTATNTNHNTVLRAHALEIVDSFGKVRVSITIQPPVVSAGRAVTRYSPPFFYKPAATMEETQQQALYNSAG